MKKVLLCVAMSLLAVPAMAQYNGPAVEACRAFALKELQRDGIQPRAVVIERDSSLSIERATRKVGNQPVRSVLTGNGAVVYEGSPSAELSFLCLLADEKRPVFFSWQARPNAPALAQCLRSEELRGNERSCLELLLRIAEQDLTTVYAYRFQEANERGEQSLAAYRKANDEWREYRDAECARRRDLGPASIGPDDYQLSCVIDLTRRRALDMR
jgi:uncharacterized protein YecT (DUF1311 family)